MSAAMVGVLTSLFAVAAPTLTISMQPKYSNQASIRPAVTVSGISGSFSGWMEFRRYSGTSCSGGYWPRSSVSVTGNNTYTGPEVQDGSVGQFSLWVRLRTSSTVYDTECFPYLVQRPVTVTATLPKSVYDNNDRMEPAVQLANTTTDAGGQVEVARWATPGCGPATGTSIGILPVVGGKPQGTVNMQDGVMGVHSYRITYSGDTKNSAAATVCNDYTIGVYIRGKVFEDNDGSGTLDPGEEGVRGVVVTVRKGQTVAGSATTNSSGSYEVLITSTGTFTVSAAAPSGYEGTGLTELTVQVSGTTVSDRNFGVAQVPSTLLPMPTTSTSDAPLGDAPKAASDSGFALLSFLALGLVALAAVAMLVLVFALRGRNESL